MDMKWIRNLVGLMAKAELTELEIEDQNEGIRVHLRRGNGDPAAPPLVQVHSSGGGAAPMAAPLPMAAAPAQAEVPADSAPADTVPFLSPMVGTFYLAPSPDSDPFVETGTKVDEDSVVCIIEAMKVMNEIKAETRGEVVQVLVDNGEPVEFGQPLLLLKPR